MYAVFYNVGMLREILPFKTTFSDYRWSIFVLLPHIVGFPIIGLLSMQGRLSTNVEIALGATAIVSAVAWIWAFYVMWKGLLDRARNAT